jgi:hypothetical protein
MLKNFHTIKESIHFHVRGNSGTIRMYVSMPASLRTYFENIFYAAYPTSDLIQVPAISRLDMYQQYLHFDADAQLATREYYVQE